MGDDEKHRVGKQRSVRRWLVAVGLLLVFLVLFVAALPWIVAQTSLRQAIIPRLLPEFAGTSHIGGAELGWFSTVKLEEVRLVDARGEVLLEGGQLSVDRTLLDLLRTGINGATIRVIDPSIHLVVFKNGSNWEQALQPLFAQQAAPGPLPEVSLQILGAEVQIYDASGQSHGVISEWRLSGRYRPNEALPLSLESSALISDPNAPATSGRISAVLRLTPPTVAGEQGSGEITLKTESLAFGSLAPLAARFVPAAAVEGATTADVTIGWSGRKAQIEGSFQGKDLAIRSDEWLAGDTLSLDSCAALVQLDFDGEQLQLNRCEVKSELASCELEANLQIDPKRLQSWKSFSDKTNFRIAGQVDLARLAAQLPALLRIRPDARVTSGQIAFSVQSMLQEDLRQWNASLTATAVEAIAAGRPIRWEQPVTMHLSAVERQNGQVVGNLKCDCDYLSIEANGSTADATIAAQGDLTRLTADLKPLIDLQGLHLAGRFDASVDLQHQTTGKFDANGHVLIQGLEFWFPGWRPFREDRITLSLQTKGEARKGKLPLLEKATLRINSAGDQLEVSLGGPLSIATLITGWPIEIRAQGRLASWLEKMQTWLPIPDWQLQGQAQLTVESVVGLGAVDIKTAKIEIGNLRAVSPDYLIEESSVLATVSGKWDRVNHEIIASSVAVRLPSAVFWTEKLQVDLASDKRPVPTATGDLFVRADLSKLQQWITARQADPKSKLTGQLEGRVSLDTRATGTAAQGSLAIKNFEIHVPSQATPSSIAAGMPPARPLVQPVRWKPIWKEREFVIQGRGRYDAEKDRLVVDTLQVESGPLQILETSGTFAQLSTATDANLSGRVKYDLQRIVPLLKPYLGAEIEMTGNGNHPFHYRGRLPSSASSPQSGIQPWWVDANAGAAFSWDKLDLYGLQTGKGGLQAALQEGVIRFQPIDLDFGGGRLKTTPWIPLKRNPQVLHFSKDTVLDRAILTEKLCRDWLQYLAPAFAQATRASGSVFRKTARVHGAAWRTAKE